MCDSSCSKHKQNLIYNWLAPTAKDLFDILIPGSQSTSMSSGIRFTSLPDLSEVGKIWQELEVVISSLKDRLERREHDYSQLAPAVVNNLKDGLGGIERLDQLHKLRVSWHHIQKLERELRFCLKQQRRLLEAGMSRAAEELGNLNVT
ncbi:hypothetical protein FBEOM_14012 [Fusarium beomiforme]|uniref:Uncharacterized protein n=1 Tax=Fusarium beomiforme TaxID=44412 RepID=A0A9P5A5A0_9HYPO|nr:hypothetical protein FBEOM_14012 [Fusarium beomiforme]